MKPRKNPSFQLDRLYDWYGKNQRKLPFRETRDPYSIWVSEIMLQQTRVAAMLPRYAAFMKKFPDIRSLAKSSEDEVVQAWQGLGYYSRARNLRKGAQHVLTHHSGNFPVQLADALKIPGVGPYTAAAVLSIAYNQNVPVIDGNVERVFSRLFYPEAKGRSWFKERAERLIAHTNIPAVHNQSIMELGALVCLPGRPDCESCVLQEGCAVFRAGGPELARLVPSPRRESRLEVRWQFFAFQIPTRGEEAFCVLKDPAVPFLKGQWLFPSTMRLAGKPRYASPGLGDLTSEASLPVVKHSITKHNIYAQLLVAKAPRAIVKACEPQGRDKNGRTRSLSATPKSGVEWQVLRRSDLADFMPSSLSLKLIKLLDQAK
ncbi:MAG: A/G-specific adenine glycosylase [Leptospirales bacterium]|nr:A/G-specific adenine glycosylase [Leptospirales bacterium]